MLRRLIRKNTNFKFCIPFSKDYFQHGIFAQDDISSIQNADTGMSLIQKSWAKVPGQPKPYVRGCLTIKTKNELKHKQHILFNFF